MKKILVLLLMILWVAETVWAGNGSFLILKSAYLYKNPAKTGRKRLTRTKKAYDVVNISRSKNKYPMLQIVFPTNSKTTNGSGYVIEEDADLRENGETIVKVYPQVPKINKDLTRSIQMSATQLQFTGRNEVSPDFPHVTWKEVNYKAVLPFRYWVTASAGIYRPDKNADWLNEMYQLLEKQKTKSILKNKVLSGLIEKGFTSDLVKMTMGAPQKIQPLDDGESVEWHYSNRKVIFKNQKVVQIL